MSINVLVTSAEEEESNVIYKRNCVHTHTTLQKQKEQMYQGDSFPTPSLNSLMV